MKGQTRRKKRKIAICSYLNRVCPRLELGPEILIYDFKISRQKPFETIDISGISADKILNILLRRDVEVIICGGCREKFQEVLRGNHIEVIWGVAGELPDVLESYGSHKLTCGIGLVSSPQKKL